MSRFYIGGLAIGEIVQAVERVRGWTNLPDNWDSYGSCAPGAPAIDSGCEALVEADEVFPDDAEIWAFPGSDAVEVEVRLDGRRSTGAIECGDGSDEGCDEPQWLGSVADGEEYVRVWGVERNKFREAWREILDELRRLP